MSEKRLLGHVETIQLILGVTDKQSFRTLTFSLSGPGVLCNLVQPTAWRSLLGQLLFPPWIRTDKPLLRAGQSMFHV